MEQIGRYQVVGELGRGAMGVVYRALDPAIGRTIAIKTIRLSSLTDPDERNRLRDRLMREAQSAGILSHPNIVTIYDVSEEGDTAYVFMEFVNGPTLERLLGSPNPPGNEEILGILRQTAAALDYAHRKNIVHRDIKPANIMIHEDGSAKIADFGVAKILTQQMTQTIGTIMGTPSYMSPEQIQGHPVDGRADQFALGVIAYELLTGEKPFIGDSLPSLLYKIVRDEPAAPQRMNPTLAAQVETVLRKSLSKNPDRRYANCAEFIAALASACNSRKGWKTQPRGTSQNLPTMAASTGGAQSAGAAPVATPPAVPPAAVLPPPRRPRRLEDEAGPPSRGRSLARAIAAALGAIVVVAFLLAAAQKWLSERSAPSRRAAQPAAQSPAPETPAVRKPSPASPPPAPAAPVANPQPAASAEPDKPPAEPEPPPRKPAPSEEVVQLTSVPPGATLIFDGNPQISCHTPCSIPLMPGRHTVVATLEGYRRASRILVVPEEMTIDVKLDQMSGSLAIRTTPPGATIFVDGKEQPAKSPTILTLPAGRHKVILSKEGYTRDDNDVEIRDGGLRSLEVELSPQR